MVTADDERKKRWERWEEEGDFIAVGIEKVGTADLGDSGARLVLISRGIGAWSPGCRWSGGNSPHQATVSRYVPCMNARSMSARRISCLVSPSES